MKLSWNNLLDEKLILVILYYKDNIYNVHLV